MNGIHPLHKALNIVLPPLCASCSARVETTHGFCGSCWAKLDFITKPYCVTCGLPFPFTQEEAQENTQCGECLKDAPAFASARAPLSYTDASRQLLLPYKHHDATHLTPALVQLMRAAAPDILEKVDMIIPVPLHWLRLLLRRYNQSALLAAALAKNTGKAYSPTLLRRIRPTPSQGKLTRAQRLLNVKGAFAVPSRKRAQLKGKTLLVVDDVMTTGATVNACAHTLMQAGAKAVYVLTAARVAKSHD